MLCAPVAPSEFLHMALAQTVQPWMAMNRKWIVVKHRRFGQKSYFMVYYNPFAIIYLIYLFMINHFFIGRI